MYIAGGYTFFFKYLSRFKFYPFFIYITSLFMYENDKIGMLKLCDIHNKVRADISKSVERMSDIWYDFLLIVVIF